MFKKRLDRLQHNADSLTPKPSAEPSAAGEEAYNEICELFLTKYNLNIRVPKEERERRYRAAVPDDQYCTKLWQVLEPFPEAKELLLKHMRKWLTQKEAVKPTESPAR